MTDANKRAPADDPERAEQRKEIQDAAKRMAKEKGLDWNAMSKEERRELKRSARQQMKGKQA